MENAELERTKHLLKGKVKAMTSLYEDKQVGGIHYYLTILPRPRYTLVFVPTTGVTEPSQDHAFFGTARAM